jgi:Fic family protein
MVSDRGEWPEVTYETLPWEFDESSPVSRTVRRRHLGPYRAALVPSIASQSLRLDSGTAARVEDAATEIARFDAELGQEIAPFSAILLRSESAASSNIEQLTASARAIAEAELRPLDRTNASLIVANVAAMDAAIALSNRLDGNAILAMHEALMIRSQPSIAGQWRQQQVWIGGQAAGPHEAMFVPPHHRHLPAAMDDLLAYLDRDDVPVLVQAAIVHAHFETIHPFPDGNGRTGRALLHAQLRNKGLTRNVTVPVSAGLLADTASYFGALDAYRSGNPVPIVERLAEAAFVAIGNGRRLVEELRAVRATWVEQLKLRRDASAWRALDVLMRHPVVNARLLADELGVAAPNVYRALEPLLAADIVAEFTDKRRNQLWRAPDVLSALDAFAVRSGRRTLPNRP